MSNDSFILGHLDNGNQVGCVIGEIEVVTSDPDVNVVKISYATIKSLKWEGCMMTVLDTLNHKVIFLHISDLPKWLADNGFRLEFYTPEAVRWYYNKVG